MKVSPEQALEVALDAALAAGKLIAEMREKRSFTQSYKKVDTDLVTTADLESEKLILGRIKQSFPEHSILSEEFHSKPDAEVYKRPLWIIDPIDGTTNYAHGLAHCAVSIAFAEEGTVQAGVVHSPFIPETFTAIKGQGAFLNSKAIKANDVSDLKSSLICTGFAGREHLHEIQMSQVSRVLENCRELRRFGAASLDICWVACARLDGFFESLSPWDIAAACLIAREAGAFTGHLHDRPADSQVPPDLYASDLIVSAPKVFELLKALLR